MNTDAASGVAVLRKRLQPRAPWLSAFIPPLDTKIRNRCSQVVQADVDQYEPQQIESLLNDIAARIDAALSHRRDALDLDILALKHVMDYELYLQTYKIDLDIAREGIADEQAKLQAAANRNASNLFTKAVTKDALAEPLSVQADGVAKAAEVSLLREQSRWKLINDRSKVQAQFQLDWNARHMDPGGAHNFAERYSRVVDLLLDDVEEAYTKARAVQLGLQSVFNVDISLPDLTDTTRSLLDDLVRWSRSCVREYDRTTRKEVEYQFIAAAVAGSAESNVPYCSRQNFDAHMAPGADGEVVFDLSGAFSRFSSARVKSIGLSTRFELPGDLTTRDYRRLFKADCIIYPPKQANRLRSYDRAPLFLGGVGSEYSDVALPVTGRSAENLNPDGLWKITVGPNLMGPDKSSSPRGAPLLTDIVLHLNLAVLTR